MDPYDGCHGPRAAPTRSPEPGGRPRLTLTADAMVTERWGDPARGGRKEAGMDPDDGCHGP
jgi:hypothetical protein